MALTKEVKVTKENILNWVNTSEVVEFIKSNLTLINKGLFPNFYFHNIKHYVNVALISLFIASNFDLNKDYLKILCDASLLHDIGRIDDIYDFNHGYIGSILVNDILKDQEFYHNQYYLDLIRTIILGHNKSPYDKTIYSKYLTFEDKPLLLLKILRDADILERLRLDSFKLKLDELSLEESESLIKFIKYIDSLNLDDEIVKGDLYNVLKVS